MTDTDDALYDQLYPPSAATLAARAAQAAEDARPYPRTPAPDPGQGPRQLEVQYADDALMASLFGPPTH